MVTQVFDALISPEQAKGLLKLTLIMAFGVLVLRATFRRKS